uniref:Putative ovule protein n=1 Tax=Solanum chacoense TaxID=4108 RepID=A0A0V0I0T8_SOLCH
MPSDVRSLLESWNGHKITSIQKQLWKTYPCVFSGPSGMREEPYFWSQELASSKTVTFGVRGIC